ncbi:MAG: DNA polymerase III subunit beta [Clostridia bacterium]|nr:DNA polymerase III subunit beta [Clostridia bacterium]
MKLTCEREALSQCVQIVQHALPSRALQQILEGIYLQAKDNCLILRCSNGVLNITSKIPAFVSKEGAIVLPGRLFCEFVRRLPQGMVTIEKDELTARLACGSMDTSLQGMNANEYPQIAEMEDARSFSINQDILKKMIQRTSFAVAQDESKPILTGEMVEIERGNINFVALDGYRLAIATETTDENMLSMRYVVPGRSLSEIAKLIGDSQDPVSLSFTKQSASVQIGDTNITTRLLEGEYINYKQILPAQWQTRIQINVNELLDAVDRASLIAREGKNNLIKMDIREKELVIMANSESGCIVENIPVEVEGKPLSIAFNAQYISEMLRATRQDEVYMDFISNLSPCIIRPLESEEFLYLVLPVRILS